MVDPYNLGKVVEPEHIDLFSKLNKYKINYTGHDLEQVQTCYLFMTAPTCNFSDTKAELEKTYPFLNYLKMSEEGRSIIKSLSFGISAGEWPIINLITNTATSFTPVGSSANVEEVGKTWNRIRHIYMGEENDSRSGGNFNIGYTDVQGLHVLKLHKLWYDYAHLVRRGLIAPHDSIRKGKMIDYPASLYFFAVAPDGYTLIYWAKYTGVTPTGIPYDSISYSSDPGKFISFDIPYSFVWKDDLNPEILTDFNLVMRRKFANDFKSSYSDVWNEKGIGYSSRIAGYADRVISSTIGALTGMFKDKEYTWYQDGDGAKHGGQLTPYNLDEVEMFDNETYDSETPLIYTHPTSNQPILIFDNKDTKIRLVEEKLREATAGSR